MTNDNSQMKWTRRRLQIGRQLFGILFSPENASEEQKQDVLAEENAELEDEENLYNPDPCVSCGNVHAGHHCPTQ